MSNTNKDPFYAFYSKEKTEEMLTAFYTCTALKITLVNSSGDFLFSLGETDEFCKELMHCIPSEDLCYFKQHESSIQQALSYGGSYIYTCHAGLYHIVFPLTSFNKVLGSIVIGPFLLEEPDSSMILTLKKRYQLNTDSMLKLSMESHHLKIITPELAEQYRRLLFYLVESCHKNRNDLLIDNQKKLKQQTMINDTIERCKKNNIQRFSYPFDLEQRFVSKITSSDIDTLKKELNELIGLIFIYERYDISKIRHRFIELCSAMSRSVIARGIESDSILSLNDELIDMLYNSDDIFFMAHLLEQKLELYAKNVYYTGDDRNHIIDKAAAYISSHFSEPLSLKSIGQEINVNPTYLSTVFKKTMGISFSEYLNKLRIEEAQYLLIHTSFSIIEIGISCGFASQSYFTRVFKQETGLTPKQFRDFN